MYLLQLNALSDARAGKSRCTKVIFIWAVRDSSMSFLVPSPSQYTLLKPHCPFQAM